MKYVGICFLGLAIFFTAFNPVFAQGEEGVFFYDNFQLEDRVNLGVRGGAVLPQMDKTYTFNIGGPGDVDIKGKNGFFVIGILTYDLGDYLAIGVESGYMEYDLEFTDAGTYDMGTARNIPLFGDIILQYPFDLEEYVLVPYGIFGVGVVFTDFKESDWATTNNISVSTKNAFAMKYGAGFDFYITDSIAINVEGAYLDTDIDTTIAVTGIGSDSNDIRNDSWMVGGGLKYLF
ncbi:MAG: OmpW family outer membrane protein [Candidatus Omnitrophota bacterium]|nr:OmpW family outer membrane protein [Candidatus Omnitrophota bacterium]